MSIISSNQSTPTTSTTPNANAPITMNEYTFSVDNFNHPLILTGADAVCTRLVEIIMLEKGTYLTRPDLGVGIVSRYRFSDPDAMTQLQTDINTQISTYLPDLISATVTVTQSNNIINIAINVDNTIYTLMFNTTAKTLSSL